MKKTLKLLLVGTLFITLMNFATVPTFSQASSQATIQATSQATSQAAISFSDISGHWAEKAILQAVQKGYVDGYPDGTFKPDGKVSRAELIKMVVTALKLTHGPAGDHWYDTYVNAAVSNQIYQYDFTGDLNNSMTRQELSIIGVRATREDIRNEKDFELKRFMFEATKTGIVQGLGNGELGIDQTTTRAQAVTIIERLLNINSGGKEKVDKYAVSSAEIAWHKTNIFSMLPDIFDKKTANGKNAIDVWNGNDMGLKTDNGLFSGALDSIVVIDLADKKDPNWSLVPANLTWFSFHKEYPVRDYSDGYLILPQMHIDYNKDKSLYPSNELIFNLFGFDVNTDLDKPGILNSIELLWNVEGYLISKTGNKFDKNVSISIEAPAMSAYAGKKKELISVVQ